MRKPIVAGVAMTSAAAFALIAPGQAGADPATTTVTFTVNSGSLSITAPGEEELIPNPTEPSVVSATFSEIKVTDDRRGVADWTVYVSGGGFTLDDEEAGLPAAYAPGEVTKTGNAQVAASPEFTLTGVADQDSEVAIEATGVQGKNTAAWYPTITVTVPENALAGTYTSTIVHSVS